MKRMVERLQGDGKYKVRVDLYLYLFLKFISSVVPTIDYDFTITVDTSKNKDDKIEKSNELNKITEDLKKIEIKEVEVKEEVEEKK
jgi:hypothetical protein